tara:strand:- start:1056 stop:2066 length:1011 start_codon:yes stop_codon:yes gene_type:complete
MIKKNNFFIENLKSVVFIGQSDVLSELVKINKSLKLNTLIITSSDQSKLIDKKISHEIFDKIDNKFKNYINKSTKVNNTIFISLGARYIFKKEIIKNFFLNNLINFHHSRLPLDSGGADISWRIMREDRISNQLVHVVDEGIDTGPILDTEMTLFPRQCQLPIDFHLYMLKCFLKFYKNFIKQVQTGKNFEMKSQQKYIGRYNPRLNTEIDGLINWDMNSYDLYSFINAFDEPYKGSSTFLNSGNFGKLYIKKVHLHGGDSSNHPYMSGIVTRHDSNWIVVSTNSKHMLLIEEVLDEKNKNIIKSIKPGDRFYTPHKELEKSKNSRRIITSKGLQN